MGIDASLNSTGWVVIEDHGDGNLIRSGVIGSDLKGIERAMEIDSEIGFLLKKHEPNLVYLEGYSYGSKGKSVMQIGELGGLLRKRLFLYGPYKEIPPSVVKKFATGKGNSKKEDMKLAVFKKWGIEFETNDETDAFVLAKMAEKELMAND